MVFILLFLSIGFCGGVGIEPSPTDGIVSQNTAVATSLIFEANKKTVNDIYLNTVAKGMIEFDAQQMSDLQSIAFQCSLTGGSAVYEARSLLTLEMDTVYDDNLLCAGAQGMRRNDNLSTVDDYEGFHLYPNPARDQVTLLMPSDILNGKMVLMNAQGAVVKELRLREKSRSAVINTGQLVEGIYLLNVFDNNRKVYSEKLVIVH